MHITQRTIRREDLAEILNDHATQLADTNIPDADARFQTALALRNLARDVHLIR